VLTDTGRGVVSRLDVPGRRGVEFAGWVAPGAGYRPPWR
jgi:hypothetical protein